MEGGVNDSSGVRIPLGPKILAGGRQGHRPFFVEEEMREKSKKTISVFKVVIKYASKLYASAFAEGAALVWYEPHKWTSAPGWLAEKGYYLLAFSTYEYARRFASLVWQRTDCGVEIWEAETNEIIPEKMLPPFCELAELKNGQLQAANIKSGWFSDSIMTPRLRLLRRLFTLPPVRA